MMLGPLAHRVGPPGKTAGQSPFSSSGPPLLWPTPYTPLGVCVENRRSEATSFAWPTGPPLPPTGVCVGEPHTPIGRAATPDGVS